MVKVVGQDNNVSINGEQRKVLIDPTIILRGEKGEKGIDGLPGKDGLPGRDGVDGKDGKDGKDGRDGIDGKDGISYWIEYDKKTNTLVFKNDGGKKNPDPIKLPTEAKGWGFGAGGGRGGVTAQSDWNQTDKNAVDYIKNKPEIHNIQLRRVDVLPATGEPYVLYLVPVDDPESKNIYDEYIWAIQTDQSYAFEKLGTTEVDLSGYVKSVNGNDPDENGNVSLSFFAKSTTAAATVEKVVSIPSIKKLETGTTIIVQPTATSTVANSKIKLNNFDSHLMRYNNANITTSTRSVVWNSAYLSIFTFDGTYWQFVAHGIDNNTTYSSMSVLEGTTGTATSNRVIRADYLKSIIQGTKLTGLNTSTAGNVVATDTILSAFGKIQATIGDVETLINAL